MQVTLTAQPVFDPRKARAWVKAFEPPEEIDSYGEDELTEDEEGETETDEAKTTQPKEKKRGRGITSPTPGLLGKLASTGLGISYANNKMRFIHPVIGGYLAGRALSGFKANATLLEQPDLIGKFLAMRYLA